MGSSKRRVKNNKKRNRKLAQKRIYSVKANKRSLPNVDLVSNIDEKSSCLPSVSSNIDDNIGFSEPPPRPEVFVNNNKQREFINPNINLTPKRKRDSENTQCDNFRLTGRRIVDVFYFVKQILNFPHHGLFSCTSNQVYVNRESRSGLISTFTLTCKICNVDYLVKTEDPQKKTFNVNVSAVNGSISVGMGYTQVSEFLGSLDVPSFSKNKYQDFHNELVEVYNETAWTSMLEAGIEESSLAIANKEVDKAGHPMITVIADGAWSKRSYKSNYNAKSGVAAIIGYRSQKILFLGIKNKYCSSCKFFGEGKEHICYKNFDGPSTAMESSTIVEGFKCSLAMHGIIYKTLVADGDSSVYKKILESRPYGDTVVEKVECRNHLLRNYCNVLRALTTKKTSSEGKQVPPALRAVLKNNILRLRMAVDCATKYHKDADFELSIKIDYLKTDISNSVYHVFGDHKNCLNYYCKRKEKNETNFIPRMRDCGLLRDVEACTLRLKYHAKSLLKYLNNNSCERYNSVVAKFVGGKRINFASRGSYQLRCNAAAISFNTKGNFHNYVHKKITGRSPGIHTKTFVAKSLAIRNRVLKKGRRLFSSQNNRQAHTESDENYGPNADKVLEIDPQQYQEIKDDFLKKLNKNEEEIKQIFQATVNQRSCDEWFSERRKRITASNFGRIVKLKATTDKDKVAHNLIFKQFFGNMSTKYGVENEQVALKELGHILEIDILESGLFIHPQHYFLAASPDGLIGKNMIAEVKCPFAARNMSPQEAIEKRIIKYGTIDNTTLKFTLNRNHSYYYQVQGQLFVTGKKFCYFAIWTSKGVLYERIKFDENFCNIMVVKLQKFYFENYLPILLKEIVHEIIK